MAENTPTGTANRRAANVITIVLMIAGIIDTLSVLYSHANRLGFRQGTPLIRIYPIRDTSTTTVITVAPQTSALKAAAFSF